MLQGENGYFMESCSACAKLGRIQFDACDSIADRPIINVGCIYGTHDSMKMALAYYSDVLASTNFECWDQLLWSLLVWYGDLVRVIGNRRILFLFAETSAVCTVGTAAVVDVDETKRVVNLHGDLCSLLHQYDRFADYEAWVERGQELKFHGSRIKDLGFGRSMSLHQLVGRIWLNAVEPPVHLREAVCSSRFRIRAPYPNSVCYPSRLEDSEYKGRMIQYGEGFELISVMSGCSRLKINGDHLCFFTGR